MSNEKTGLDHLADLWAGRYANNFTALLTNDHNLQKGLQTIGNVVVQQGIAIQELQKENQMSTANEQKIIDAANTLSQAAGALQSGLEAKNQRIAQLEQQIRDLGEQPPPEDLSQEFTEFDNAMASITNLANSLTPVSESGPVNPVPDVTGPAITQPAVEIPLAGESGTTNPVVEGGGPAIDQQAPGVPIESAPEATEESTGKEAEDNPFA